MDYEGKYFPEENNEESDYDLRYGDPGKKKKPKIGRKIFKYIIYGISLAVYILVFWRIIVTSDSSLVKQMIFSPETRAEALKNPDEFEVLNVFPPEFMNKDGTFQIKKFFYAPEFAELEFATRYNPEKIGDSDPVYKIFDSSGKEYTISNFVRDKKGANNFDRICFRDIKLDLDKNRVNRTEDYESEYSKLYEDGYALAPENEEPDTFAKDYANQAIKGISYTLKIYKSDGKTLIFSTEIYNNSVYISDTNYREPKDKFVKGEESDK